MKHNIMSEGVLSSGDLLPDVNLWTLDGCHAKLSKTGGIQVPPNLKNPSETETCSTVKVILTTSAKLPPSLENVGFQLQLCGSRLHPCLYKVDYS